MREGEIQLGEVRGRELGEIDVLCPDRGCSSIPFCQRSQALQSRRTRGRESALSSEIAGDQ